MKKETILVFAPHPDDEVLGCGGYMAKQHAEGTQVYVVIVSDGALGLPKGSSPEVRQQECRAGLAHLAIINVQFWNYSDGRIPLSGAIVGDYWRVVEEIQPTQVLLPNPQESHSDHLRVTRGFLNALEGRWQGQLLFYETVQPAPFVNHLVDIAEKFRDKLLAIQAHTSKLHLFDYVTYVQNLASLRGLQAGSPQAEAFLLHEWDGSYQHFFETRPLISVIVRADEMSYLRHALMSLIYQTYDQLEVVVVWYGTETPSLQEFELLDIHYIQGKTSRSFNLNLGLSQVRGEYVAILDQDDILYQQHFASLLADIHGYPKIDIVYSGCKVVACQKIDNRIKVNKVLDMMNHAWHPARLLIGNRIPIHALLFRANVFHSHQFDETLDAYEDWEFLARLTLSNFTFAHFDDVTCEYRAFSETGDQSLSQIHQDKGYTNLREKVLAKLLNRLDVKHFKHLVDLVGKLETQQTLLETQLAEETHQRQELAQQLEQSHSQEQLLAKTCQAIGIEVAGRQGVAQLMGRVLPQQTLFSIILPVYNTDVNILSQTLFSVRNQAYPGWELCLVDDASDREETQQLLQALQNDTMLATRLHYKRRDTQGGIVAASNDAINMATAPYLVFLDHDDRLHSEALLFLALELQQQDYTLLYTDSRMIDHGGQLMHTAHKIEWSPETLLHINYINHLVVVKREFLNTGLGNFNGVQDWALLLQLVDKAVPEHQICHVSQPLYDWRATKGSLAYQDSEKSWVVEAAQSLLAKHLQARGFKEVSITPNKQGAGFISQWNSPLEPIEIIIPTYTNLDGLKTCLNGLLHQTDYPQMSITIVANRCSALIHDYLKSLQSQIRVLVNDNPFNWSTLNNQAIKAGNSSFLLFLNDDIEINHANWLRDLRRYLDLTGVGAVGATLFYPDDSLQHNGIHTDPQWIAANITEWGTMNELRVTRNVSAVTGACLLTKRHVWEQVGGFDEKLAVSYNDVDFCLAIRAQGLRIVQAIDIELIHHEHATYGMVDNSKKQALWQQETHLMQEKWGEQLIERYMPHYDVQIQQTHILPVE
jgi:GT2 family glycosyltransferase/LmbE family N-acetylglucosaminyl deacetylase